MFNGITRSLKEIKNQLESLREDYRYMAGKALSLLEDNLKLVSENQKLKQENEELKTKLQNQEQVATIDELEQNADVYFLERIRQHLCLSKQKFVKQELDIGINTYIDIIKNKTVQTEMVAFKIIKYLNRLKRTKTLNIDAILKNDDDYKRFSEKYMDKYFKSEFGLAKECYKKDVHD